MVLETQIFNRHTVTNINPNIPHVIVSITNEEKDHPDIPTNSNCRGIIRLKFADADPSYQLNMRLMNQLDAKEILGLVLENFKGLQLIICQCDGGVARSAATAAALSYIINGDDKHIFNSPLYVPNMHVYNTILREFGDNKTKYDLLASERWK